MTLWVAHSGGSLVREPYALENACVVTVWENLPDPTGMKSVDELRSLMSAHYTRAGQPAIDSWARQLWRFIHAMKAGDFVVMPRVEAKAYAVGIVKGSYEYKIDAPPECRHTHPVQWIEKCLPRSAIEEDMYYSFKAHISFYEVTRNNIESRLIRKLGTSFASDVPQQ